MRKRFFTINYTCGVKQISFQVNWVNTQVFKINWVLAFTIGYSQHPLSRHPRDLSKNVEISECQHKRRLWYADEFSLCLMYKCACLTYKSMGYVCSCPITIVCVNVINS